MHHLTDNEFERQFGECTLDPAMFSHEAHLRLAWIHLRKYGLHAAIDHVCAQLARYDRVHGDGMKFHKTLTVAAVHMIAHFMEGSDAKTFDDFLQEFPRLKTDFRDLIHQHYSDAVLYHARAKSEYLAPDRGPF